VIIIDTSALSLAFRRRTPGEEETAVAYELKRLIEEDAPLAIPGIVLQELLSGVKGRDDVRRIDDALGAFALLLANRKTHVRAAEIANSCRQRGIAASAIDCLIAAHAILANGSLFTVDDDFRRMSSCCGLRLHVVP
jgi:predicted nucleic acid-binding protein